jgi:hypothetical protein
VPYYELPAGQVSVPDSIESLYIKAHMVFNLANIHIPSNLVHLRLGGSFRGVLDLRTLPRSLETLTVPRTIYEDVRARAVGTALRVLSA